MKNEEVLYRSKEERNVLRTVRRRKADWIGQMLSGDCLLKHVMEEFSVLFIVHPGIILISNQLDAQFFFLILLFQFSSCFEQSRAPHQENRVYQYDILYM